MKEFFDRYNVFDANMRYLLPLPISFQTKAESFCRRPFTAGFTSPNNWFLLSLQIVKKQNFVAIISD